MKQCLMLVGRSGSGKTSVMETLSGSEVKNAREIQSVTRFGPEIQVKETYGFFSNMQNLQCCIQDIESCIQSFSGIDVIGLVIRIGRFTLEERDMIEIFRDTLGEGAFNFTVVIFTNLDNLLYDDVSLSEFLADSPKQLQDLLSLCSGSYVCFDNKGPEADRQGYAKSLIEAMKDLKERNMSARYTYDMMEIAMKAKMVKDEEKAKTEEDNAHVFRERAKLDMRAEVEAKVRRELVQEKIQLANRARLLEENKINKESWKTGSEDTGHVRTIFSQHVGDHGGKALQNMPLKDQRRGGLEHTQPPKDQGRNRREDRGYTDDHWTSGREDRGYIKDHLTSGRKNRSYSEDHGWSGLEDRGNIKDYWTSGREDRGYTEDQGRSGREDRGNIKDYWTSGREDRGYTEDQGRSGREDRGNIKDYWTSGREDRGYTEDQGRSGREDRGNIKDYWRSGREGRGYREDNGRSGLWDRRCRERGIKGLPSGETESQRSNQALPILGTQTTLDFSKNKTNHYFVPRSRDDPSNDKIDVNQRPNPRTQHSTMSPNGAPKIAPKLNRLKLNEKAKSENPTVWVCRKCFEPNDTSNSCCATCGEERIQLRKRPSAPDLQVQQRLLERPRRTQRPLSEQPVSEKKREVATVKPIMSNGVDKSELRVVLIGKTGVGKSSTANTILGSKVFKAKASPISVTEKCDFERSERFGKRILLVDTPGLFDTSTPKEIIDNEVKKCIGISAPGPHAFLLVMSFTNRFTEEERKVLTEVRDVFGDQMIKYLIVMFTGRDQMEKDFLVEHHVQEYPEEFRRIVNNAGGGYITVNNRGSDSEKEDDVEKLLNRIEQMVKRNGGGHFTSEMFEAAEKVIQQRIAEEIAERKEQIRKEVEEEIRKKVELEMNAKMDAEQTHLKHLHERVLRQYEILKREVEKARMRGGKKSKGFKTTVSAVLIDEMKTNAEKKLLRQIEETEGPERAEVQKQLAGAGREIQQLLAKRRADARDPQFEEDANEAAERHLAMLRDEERKNIRMETGTLAQIRKSLKGFGSSFLNLFR